MDELTVAGVSIWLDDLARTRITSGNLTHMIDTACVRGVTTNPTIFEKALASGSSAYGEQIAMLAAADVSPADAVRTLTSDDVRAACDLFLDVWRESDGVDGRVSIEVDPRLAHDTQGTVTEASLLWDLVEETRWWVVIRRTPCASIFGTGDVETLSRACDPYIGKASLFLQLLTFANGTSMWEDVLFHTGQEDDWELETFGGVERHQRHHAL